MVDFEHSNGADRQHFSGWFLVGSRLFLIDSWWVPETEIRMIWLVLIFLSSFINGDSTRTQQNLLANQNSLETQQEWVILVDSWWVPSEFWFAPNEPWWVLICSWWVLVDFGWFMFYHWREFLMMKNASPKMFYLSCDSRSSNLK